MGEDDTRFGLGSDKTKVSSQTKLQVKMVSGKIYGPYTRAEVESFIRTKKVRGEELVLFEGESAWRPVSSDTDFFDLLREVQLGVKAPSRPAKAKGKVAEPETSEGFEERTRVSEATRTRASVPAKIEAPKKKRPANSEPTPSFELEAPSLRARASQDSVPSPAFPPLESAPPDAVRIPAPSSASAPKLAVKLPAKPRLLLGAAVLVLAVIVVATRGPAGPSTDKAAVVGVRMSGGLAYGKPLAVLMDGLDVKIPALPEKIEPSADLRLPLRFGAPAWSEDLKQLMALEDPNAKVSASTWARWSWNLIWLGSCLEGLRKNQGRGLLSAGEAFYRELDRRQLLNAPSKALFEGALAFSQARWSDAQASFAKASNGDMGRWLSEEAAWMGFWAAGARGGIPASGQEYESSWLEITSRLRSALVSRDAKLMQLLPQIAVEDPLAYHLWFVSAQANWRVATDKVQLAQQFFVAGLATLSLYPVSVQAVYWEQFAEFLSGFGRQSTTERALHNRDAIRAGDVESPGKRGAWWDLGQEGLDMQVLAQDVLSRLASGVVKPSDLALLQVLGFVLPAGSGALTSAGYHWAFEDNWPRAEELFERALKVDAKNTLALGGLIWAHASRYEFDEALHYHDLLKSLPSETPEAEKFMSLIQMIAREPDNARNGFQAYLKTVPNDAWGHYFFALFHYGQQKNVDCLRSATLARQHAEGELKFRANLLFYRCRVLSGVDLSGALADLRKMAERESENIAVQIELVTALDNAGLRNDAILAARDVLGRFPRSYEMRVKLGELYEKNRNEDLAVGFYRKASVDRPGSAEGWVRIARIFENQKNWKEAAANYFTAAQAEPSYPEVWLMTARAYAKSGAYEDAARMYRREIEARPTVVTSFIEAAEFMLRINAPQEVPKIFQLFKEDFQGDPRVLTRLAQAYLAMGQVEQARNAAANAVQADPNLAEPHRILGTIFEKQSMFDPARKSFERYLTLLPQADDANLIRQKLSQPPYAGN